jgi:hypothetical protein
MWNAVDRNEQHETLCFHIVTCIPTARQRLGKHISAAVNARDIKTSIAMRRRGKHASSTIEAVFCVVRAEGL